MEIGVDESWPHRIDPNPLARHFFGQADGEAVQRPFGSRVVDVFVGRSQARRHRRHVDDAATLAAVLGRHAQDRVLGAENGRQNVGLEDFENAELGHFVHPGFVPDGAGVVHQSGHTAQFGVHAVEQPDHFILDAHIGAYRDRLGPHCAHLFEHRVCSFFVSLIIDADPIAPFSRQERCRGADASAPTGDDDDFVHADFPHFLRKQSGSRITAIGGFCMIRGVITDAIAGKPCSHRQFNPCGSKACYPMPFSCGSKACPR